jgi:hypothetical protein
MTESTMRTVWPAPETPNLSNEMGRARGYRRSIVESEETRWAVLLSVPENPLYTLDYVPWYPVREARP